MDIDVVIGSAENKNRLMQKYKLNPVLIQATTPLAAIDQTLAKIGSTNRLGRLRIFNFSTSFPASQLVRLSGLFAADGSVKIFSLFSHTGGVNLPNNSTDTFGASHPGGKINVGGIGGIGGFQGAGKSNLANESRHLSSLLSVPVSFTDL